VAFSLLALAGIALVSSGARAFFVCFGLGFSGRVGHCAADLFLPFAGVLGGCAAASAYDFVCGCCNMLTCGVVFAAEAGTLVDTSLAFFETRRVLTVATSVSTVLVRWTTWCCSPWMTPGTLSWKVMFKTAPSNISVSSGWNILSFRAELSARHILVSCF